MQVMNVAVDVKGWRQASRRNLRHRSHGRLEQRERRLVGGPANRAADGRDLTLTVDVIQITLCWILCLPVLRW